MVPWSIRRVIDVPPNAKLHEMQQNTLGLVQLIRAATPLIPWGMFVRCVPGACPAHYLCVKYLISSPKFILTLGSPPSRLH